MAYAASDGGGLLAVDLADPTQPTLVAAVSGLSLYDIVVDGSVAYAKAWSAVTSLDIADPAAPRPIGHLYVNATGSVATTGDVLLAAGGDLVLVGVANPAAAPARAVMTEPVIAQRIVAAGSFAYVADEGHWLDEGGGLRVYDCADPDAPVQRAFLPLEGCDRVAHDAGMVYVAADTGLVMVDVADPDAPAIVGHWADDQWSFWSPWDLVARDGLLYVAVLTHGFLVLDVSDPTAPTLVHEIDEPGYTARLALGDQGWLFVNRLLDGIWALSLEDPAHPTIEATIPAPAYQFPYYHGGMVWRDGLLWVANGDPGVFAIDVTDLHATTVVGGIDTPCFAYDLALEGSFAYVADRDGGMQVLDVSDPSLPQLVGNLHVPGNSRDVAVLASGMLVNTAGLGGLVMGWPPCAGAVVVEGGGPEPVPAVAAWRLEAWPNPFNPHTTLHLELPVAGRTILAIHDLRGRRVRTLVDEQRAAGIHEVTWDGRDDRGRALPSGVYLSRLETSGRVVTNRMALVR
jgi:hypothetical protein